MKRIVQFITCFILLSCNDDDPIPVEDVPIWQKHNRFLFDQKIKYNSHVDEDKLYLLGTRNFSYIQFEDTTEIVEHPVVWMKYDQNYKMPISSDLLVTANARTVHFVASKDPVGGIGVWLHMEQLDPGFEHFDFPGFWWTEAMAINSRNECLVPYATKDSRNLLLVRLNDWGDNSVFMDTLETRRYSYPPDALGNIVGSDRLYTFDDVFYMSTLGGTFRIDETYAMEKVLEESFTRMFEVGDRLFGLTFRGSESRLYESIDGVSWNYLGILDNSFRQLNYCIVNDKTIAFYYSQVFEIGRTADGFDIKELSNEGLFGHRITSITPFKGKVYVTTLSGVFYKDQEDFWIEKEEDSEG